ncbi:hypothetical protein [Bradyrhizobium arachidis]|uniref:Uncharacterized protein n=1 Tax=Bradyrhizobium arachidis TaxID=858423 RepID=A0AAE7NKW0_9BRAD|nr:hypothetical protein [Bradyrhizobium arachidis]QOZ67146.1 hypothetical protein WN72_13095 [Bradyrhizobium arachidis]SFV15969.1 hypothetical protein SAMN05192541_124104 [Bradyrhizobium arachidis]
MTAISTVVPFSIDAQSPSSSSGITASKSKRLSPYMVAGSVIFLLAASPAATEASQSPTSVRSALLQNVDIVDERRGYQRATEFDRGIARLREFREYQQDWDGSGAAAAHQGAFDYAIAYMNELEAWHPAPLTTLGRDGSAILEFEEEGVFCSIAFLPDGEVELYFKDGDDASRFASGPVGSRDVNAFLTDVMNLPAIA